MEGMKTKELSVGYDRKTLIDRISLEVQAGKIVVLIGPNGAGKSTILKTVAGLLSPIKGEVLLGDRDLLELSLNERAKQIATMLTGRVSSEYMTVYDVVAAGRYPYTGLLGKLSKEDQKEIDAALCLVGEQDKKTREFQTLSDGQKQRILLARAIAQRPSYMILDEPTSFLDIGCKLNFIETLKELAHHNQIGILMSLHELEMARVVADVVVAISRDGRIDRVGTPEEIFCNSYIEQLFEVKAGNLQRLYHFKDKRETTNTTNTTNATNATDTKHTRFLMVQGTMSNAGKSLLVAGLCRIFRQDGYRVAPFKSQNMALNSYVTEDGLEMGRAQVMQAEAAGVKPSVYMNPILLKPTSDQGSQVIVNGKVLGNMRAREYFAYKKTLVPEILAAVEKLKEQADIIVIEGAGSPAEINLKENDIVNMGMAKMVDAPVLLVGDIDRGGVFAQLLGTISLLEEEERQRVKGLVINKFRGDKTILDPGITMLTKRGQIPVMGVIPYMRLQLEDEDSLSERLDRKEEALITIGVVRLPHMANFSDFDMFEQIPEVGVSYLTKVSEVEKVDLLILPGSKNTIADMRWLKESGFAATILKYSSLNKPVIGICGGYQMLGQTICDPLGVECGGQIAGLGLLPVDTVLGGEKEQHQVKGVFGATTGMLAGLCGRTYEGYEIHMGKTRPLEETLNDFTAEGLGYCKENVWGTYVHGIFDSADIAREIVDCLAKRKGIDLSLGAILDYKDIKEREYDKLADTLRKHMDMDRIYDIMGV